MAESIRDMHFGCFKSKYFYVSFDAKDEVEKALQEQPPPQSIPYSVFTRAQLVWAAEEEADQDFPTIQNNLYEFWKDKDPTKPVSWDMDHMNDDEFYQACKLRAQLKKYLKILEARARQLGNPLDHWAPLCEMVLLYKDMILDPDYNFVKWFKGFVIQNLEYLSQHGLMYSFLVLCEFCPEFVTDDCFPVVYKKAKPLSYGFEEWPGLGLIRLLRFKHAEKWNKYVQPQLSDETSLL
jgi:hypothetical protein